MQHYCNTVIKMQILKDITCLDVGAQYAEIVILNLLALLLGNY